MNKYSGIEQILRGYKGLKAQIKDIDFQIEELESMDNIGVTGIDYSKDKLSPTYAFSSQTENEAIKIADKVILLKARKVHAESLIKRIDNALDILDDEEKIVINVKYINDPDKKKSWNSLIDTLLAGKTKCWEIGQSALEKIDSVMWIERTNNE